MIFTASVLAACQKAEIRQVSVEQASAATANNNVQFVDVRTVEEYQGGHAPRAVNLPLDALESELARLDRNQPVYMICQSGRRSQKGAELLLQKGFKEIYNVEGGTSAWTAANLPLEK